MNSRSGSDDADGAASKREGASIFRPSASPLKPLRVGFICGPGVLEAWQIESIRRMAAVDGVTIGAVIRACDSACSGVERRSGSWLWRRYRALSARVHQRWAQTPVEFPEFLMEVPEVTFLTETLDCSSLTPTEDGLNSVRQLELDALLLFGGVQLRGEIHDLVEHGIWSFDHLSHSAYPGCAVGFWDVFNDRPWSEVKLSRAADRHSDNLVLYERAFRTNRYSCTVNAQHVIWRTVDWPAAVCRRLVFFGDCEVTKKAALPKASDCAPPGNLKTCLQVIRKTKRFAEKQFRDVFLAARGSKDRWALGVVDRPIEELINPTKQPAARWIEAPPGGFLADPFLAQMNGRNYIFCEHWDDYQRKGHIAVLESSDLKSFEDPYPVIEAPFHLSYPFVVKESGDWYCVPEQHQSGEIAIYRAADFPGAWEQCGVLVADFPGVDPTLLQLEGQWWLFSSCAGEKMGAAESSLFAFHSDSLRGPWVPHPLNPVVERRGRSRPAGRFFWTNGRLVRPVQECIQTYGEAILFYEITTLSRFEYAERLIGRWERSDEWPFPAGMHHIERLGNGSVLVDAKRYPDVRPSPGDVVVDKIALLRESIRTRVDR